MARYIDADALIEVLQEWRDTSSLNDGAGNPVDSILYDVIRYIEDTPTADVAPRAEVDRLRFNLNAVLDERAEDKAEVAREIFAEIEREFSGAYWYKGYTIERYIAELKKKYLEADHDPA